MVRGRAFKACRKLGRKEQTNRTQTEDGADRDPYDFLTVHQGVAVPQTARDRVLAPTEKP